MSLDADRWRERGRHTRALESLHGAPHAVNHEKAREVVRATFVSALDALPAELRETAIELAAEGYLAEHAERGGTVTR